MGKKWDVHHIITGVTKEMKEALPGGLRCVDDKIKYLIGRTHYMKNTWNGAENLALQMVFHCKKQA